MGFYLHPCDFLSFLNFPIFRLMIFVIYVFQSHFDKVFIFQANFKVVNAKHKIPDKSFRSGIKQSYNFSKNSTNCDNR